LNNLVTTHPSGTAVAGAIDQREIRRSVLSLAWPSILENLLQSGMGLVTLLMVAQLGSSAVAGVGASTQLQVLFISAFFALSMGATVITAHAFGAGRLGSASKIAKQAVIAGISLSLVFSIIVGGFAEPMMRLMGADDDVISDGARFLQISSIGFVFMAVMFILGGVLRGVGDTRTPMLVTAGINVLNVIVSYPLIFGTGPMPRLEIEGAAIGMVISRLAGCLIMVMLLWRGWRGVSIASREGWKPDIRQLRQLADIGLPSMAESMLRSGGQLLFVIIVFMLGTAVAASFQIAQNVMFLSMFPGFGFSMAATALVGQSLGAGNVARAEAASATATRACLVWMAVMGTAFFVFATPIMQVGASGPDKQEIIDAGVNALRVIAFAQPIQAIGFVLAGSLRGAGDTRWPMVSTSVSMWVFRLPLAYLFAITFGLGLVGIFLAMLVDNAILSAMNFWRYRKGSWKTRKLYGHEPEEALAEPEPVAAQ
jgi:MATE family multidrug resistance protein